MSHHPAPFFIGGLGMRAENIVYGDTHLVSEATSEDSTVPLIIDGVASKIRIQDLTHRLNIEQMGAVAGQDSQAAIEAACLAMINSGQKGHIFIPRRSLPFLYKAWIGIPDGCVFGGLDGELGWLKMIDDNPNITELDWRKSVFLGFRAPEVGVRPERVEIRNLEIDGNSQNNRDWLGSFAFGDLDCHNIGWGARSNVNFEQQPPKTLILDNIISRNAVRNCFVGSESHVIGTRLTAINSDGDHLLYCASGSGIYDGLVLEGHWRAGAGVTNGQIVRNVRGRNITANPVGYSSDTWWDDRADTVNNQGSILAGHEVEFDPDILKHGFTMSNAGSRIQAKFIQTVEVDSAIGFIALLTGTDTHAISADIALHNVARNSKLLVANNDVGDLDLRARVTYFAASVTAPNGTWFLQLNQGAQRVKLHVETDEAATAPGLVVANPAAGKTQQDLILSGKWHYATGPSWWMHQSGSGTIERMTFRDLETYWRGANVWPTTWHGVARFDNVNFINNATRGDNDGFVKLSGSGQTSVTIAHGLADTPSRWRVTASSADAADIAYTTADTTDLTVTWGTARTSGTDNLVLDWWAML